MKSIIIIFTLIALTVFVSAQKIVENPKFGLSNDSRLKITRIEINPKETILSFNILSGNETRFRIRNKSYIQIIGKKDTLFMVKHDLLPLDEKGWIHVPKEGLSFNLYFPPINLSTYKIDFGEPGGGEWKIYDIVVNEQPSNTIIPKELLGNWFSIEKGDWTYSFFDSLAVFENKIWKYISVKSFGESFEIIFENEENNKTLTFKPEGDGNFVISSANSEPSRFSRNSKFLNKVFDEIISEPVTKKTGKVVYSGMIKGFRTSFEFNYYIIQFKNNNEKITETHEVEIDKNGCFKFELSVNGMQKVNAISFLATEQFYLIPGNDLFHLINSGEKEFPSLFMSENSSINYRDAIIEKTREDIKIQNKFNEMSDKEYNSFLLSAKKTEIDNLINHQFTFSTSIKKKGKMFFIPRRSIEFKFDDMKTTISTDSFWISNEITNKDYRKFAEDMISNPKKILKWESYVRNKTNGVIEKKDNVEIYSEIAKNLIDSNSIVQVSYNNKLQDIRIIDYFKNKEFDNYPVVGVPIKGAEYYCYWKTMTENWENIYGYRIASEIDLINAMDYTNQIGNDKENSKSKIGLHEVQNDKIADINSNASEWMQRYYQYETSENKFAVYKELPVMGDSTKLEYDNYKKRKYAGFRIVRSGSAVKKDKALFKITILAFLSILIILIIVIIIWKWRSRQRLRQEQQQRRLRELELTAIRSQMNPHFLFNSLNSIQNLVQQNKGREALMYLSDFAGIIRKVLQNSEKEEISLAEELEMTRQYLNLEKLRFDFDFSISVEEEIDANNTMVPSMLIQPFAENAIVHGLQNKPDTRNLEIKIKRENSGSKNKKCLIIYIEDNGIGREAATKFATGKNGKSSKLMKDRLEKLQEKQGEQYRFKIIDLNDGIQTGTRVEIWVPEE